MLEAPVTRPSTNTPHRQRAREAARPRASARTSTSATPRSRIFIGALIYWPLRARRRSVAGGLRHRRSPCSSRCRFGTSSTMRALARAQAAVTFYTDGTARIEDRWMRAEPAASVSATADHPYADDLDVFGPGSLFQLLSACRTPMGEERLAAWLLQPVADCRDPRAPGAGRRAARRTRSARAHCRGQCRPPAIDAPEPLIAWAEAAAVAAAAAHRRS